MRLLLALTASSLTTLLLALAPARAEPSSGWVDPPAKADVKPTDRPAEPERASVAPDRPAAGPHHHHQAERDTGQRDRRRMAAPSEIDTTAPDPRFGGWAGRAERLTSDYLDSVSGPNGDMLASAPRFYGERVRFHGRSMTIAALLTEKRRFVRRWPERRYEPKNGAMRTACNAGGAVCTVRIVFGFRAENPTRGARSQGLSELSLTVSFAGERPVIVSESSRVLRRGNA